MDKIDNNRFNRDRYRYSQNGPVGLTVLTILFIFLITILWICSAKVKAEMGMVLLFLAFLLIAYGGTIISLIWIIYFAKLTADKKKNGDKNWWTPIIGITILIIFIRFIYNNFYF